MAITEIIARLERIEDLLARLVMPVEAEEARQLATASAEDRLAHNKLVLARLRQGRFKETGR